MATFTGTGNNDIAIAVGLGSILLGFIGGTTAELGDGVGDVFLAAGGDDFISAGSGADTITGGAGNDVLNGNDGEDVFVYAAAAEIGSDTIDGGGGPNTLRIDHAGVANFRTANIFSSGQTSIDRLIFTNTTGASAEFNASQLSGTGVSTNLSITGAIGGYHVVSFFDASGVVDLSGFSFTSWSFDNVITIHAAASANITGASWADSLRGSPAADTLNGVTGNDTLIGGLGADSLVGGDGNDAFRYHSIAELAGDTIDGGTHAGGFRDEIQLVFTGAVDLSGLTIQSTGTTSIEVLSLFGAGHEVTLNASQFSATGISTALGISGDNDGVDIVIINNVSGVFDASAFGFATWDNAVDRLVINAVASASIAGASEADILNGSSAADTLSGGSGTDLLVGGLGADSLVGGDGGDVFRYASFAELAGDTIDGGAHGGGFRDEIQILFTGAADLSGHMIQSTGTTSIEKLSLSGGGGHGVTLNASQFSATGVSTALILQGDNAGADFITINNVSGVFDASAFGFATWDNAVDRIIINAVASASITGASQADSLNGSSAADTLNGGLGNDILVGGFGADSLVGGNGSDAFRYSSLAELAGDTIDGGADAGGFRDEIHIVFTGAADLSGLTLQSTGTTSIEGLALFGAGHEVTFHASQFSATGVSNALGIQGDNAGADIVIINNAGGVFDASAFSFSLWNAAVDCIVINASASASITGASQADSLNGSSAADTLNGGLGNDTLNGGAGVDTASYASDAQVVAANLFGGFAVQNSGQPGALIDTLTAIENVTGGSADDFLVGDDVANRLEGGFGGDNLWGYGGNDTLIGGEGNDIIVGGDNDDSLESGLGQDWLYGQGGADTLRATDATANAFNVLVGGDGNDTLIGGPTGFDYFYGGDGATGGGNDSFVIAANSGFKVMNDFEAGGVNDVVRLVGTAITSYAQAQGAMSFSGTINGTVLVVDGATQVWFLGLAPGQLTAADFLFA